MGIQKLEYREIARWVFWGSIVFSGSVILWVPVFYWWAVAVYRFWEKILP